MATIDDRLDPRGYVERQLDAAADDGRNWGLGDVWEPPKSIDDQLVDKPASNHNANDTPTQPVNEDQTTPTSASEGAAWMVNAMCGNNNAAMKELFLSYREDQKLAAIKWCSNCAVRTECLEYSLTTKNDHGVWGGVTVRGRRQLQSEIAENIISLDSLAQMTFQEVQEHATTEPQVHPSDLTDEEYENLIPLVASSINSPRRRYPVKIVINGILYKEATGTPWDELPDDFPPGQHCLQQRTNWKKKKKDGTSTWDNITAKIKEMRGDLEDAA